MQMSLFALATLMPVGLILLAAGLGGIWGWVALIYMTVLTAALDRYVPRLLPERAEGAEFPAGKGLSAGLGLAHFAVLGAIPAAVAWGGHGWVALVVTLIAAALWLGQVSHPNAHELIHRGAWLPRALGRWVYVSMLFGHHASAHVLVHHAHVGTDADPNSARRGQGFWRFAPRAWAGSFMAGWRAESARRTRAGKAWITHPYVQYVGGAAGFVAASVLIFGARGLVAFLVLAVYAQLQILLADYVQHYGLRRQTGADGRPEPVNDGHSWNTPHWFSSALMVNAPRHSDHHLHPTRPYPGLRLRDAMPMLPHALPVMAVIALFPPLWHRVMRRALSRVGQSG
ncbi:alkane 1-monooxygenase [Aquicoccus porphyridii]|uniref:alkane 1-monooxygenase n=1 Tax=Aquicoccus porphyridii TaxID=1852029 RepID=UPI0035161058